MRHDSERSGITQENSAQVHRNVAPPRVPVGTALATPVERRYVAGAVGLVGQTCVRPAPLRQHPEGSSIFTTWTRLLAQRGR